MRWRLRLQLAAVVVFLVAYAGLSHYSNSAAKTRDLGVGLALGPVLTVGLLLLWRWTHAWVALLGAATFSALGLLLGTAISPQQIGLIFSAIIGPMMFFGCVYYPWTGLDAVPVMKYAVLVNPMVYVAEGLRGSLTPALPHMSLAAVLGALVLLTALFCALGLRSFERRSIA